MSTRTDEPTRTDLLGREVYTRALSRIVATTQTPLVIGVHGGWGSGKTSLMMQIRDMVEREAKTKEQKVVTVWFNPWQHQFEQAPVIPLLHEIRNAFSNISKAKTDSLKLFRVLGKVAGETVLRFSTGGTVKLEDIVQYGQAHEIEYFEAKSVSERIQEHFREAVDTLVGENGRLVFFIDDLDRCLPETALRVLEALKLFLNTEKCVYFLAVDKEIVDNAIKSHYRALDIKAPDYLDKIIQLPFEIPAIVDERIDEYLGKLTDDEELKKHSPLIAWGVDRNPRTAKRYMNALYMLHLVAKDVIDDYHAVVLVKLLIIQLRFHELYRYLTDYPNTLTELEEHFTGTSPEDMPEETSEAQMSLVERFQCNAELREFLLLDSKNMVKDIKGLNLREYIHLTHLSTVEMEKIQPELEPGGWFVYGGDKRVLVDDDGFLIDPELWSEELAAALARHYEGIEEMTEEHWKVINFIRDYYLKFGIAPMIRKLCKETGLPLKRIYELFPSGPAKGACKTAGLPKPTGCV